MKQSLLHNSLLVAALVAGCTVTHSSASAAPLTPEQALDRLAASGTHASVLKARANGHPELAYTFGSAGAPAAYVFNLPASGFVLLGADDLAVPVLGWSDSGSFDPAAVPPAMQAWMETCADRLEAARRAGLQPASGQRRAEAASDRDPIAPAVTTRWGQSDPYNRLTPRTNNRSSMTGCLATALAQVLKYRAFGGTGTEKHGYECMVVNDGRSYPLYQEFDFTERPFRYDLMKDTYEPGEEGESVDEMARLMWACGVATDMNYDYNESATIEGYVPYALWKYFGFNGDARAVYRDCFLGDNAAWDEFLYGELQEQGALLYCGVTSRKEGHAFVCDGYDPDGFYHFNWGWEGMSDGWFALDSLDPEVQGIGGAASQLAFNFNHTVITGLSDGPAQRGYMPTLLWESALSVTNKNIRKGQSFTFRTSLNNKTQFGYNLRIGFMLAESRDGEEGTVIEGDGLDLPAGSSIVFSQKIVFPADVADGVYCMRPLLRTAEGEPWLLLPWTVERDHCWIEVADGKVDFTYQPGAGVEGVTAGSDDAERWYNLQGIEVAEPQHGQLYIMRAGGKTRKVKF